MLMKEKLGCLAAIVYAAVGFVQVLAIIDAIRIWLGIPWILAAFLSLIIGYIPLVGTIAGIYGATSAWGWNLGWAIALFFGAFVISIAAVAVGGVSDRLSRKRPFS